MIYKGPDIRVALIGYGLGGQSFHAPVIAATPGMRLAAIVTGNADRQRQAATEHPGARIVDAADALFRDPSGIDLVVISTPNRTHVPLALQAVEAKRPVVVDKPLAISAAEGRQLVDAARRRKVFLSVYQNRRWDGDFLTVRRLLAEQAFGTVHRFESHLDRWRPNAKGGWRELGDPREAGGLLFDLGSHLIDQALTLFGPASNVYAEVDTRRAAVAADDDVFIALRHASGVRSHLSASVLVAQSGPRLRVLGNRAAYTKISTDVQEDALRRGKRPDAPDWGLDRPEQYGLLGVGEDVRPVPTERGDYRGFYAGVLRSLRDGAPPPVDSNDAIAVLEIIDTARSLSQSGRHGS
jgi:scyllo-inositol 2-dehydrogenase (NADP+)